MLCYRPWSCERLHHPCVCLQWVVYRAGVCYVLHGRCASLHHPCVFHTVGRHRAGVCYVHPWSAVTSLHHPCVCLQWVDHGEHSTCAFSGLCAHSTPPSVCLQWVDTEQACAMFSMVVVPLYTTIVSVYSGSLQSRRVLCSPWSLCLSTPPLCLSTVGRHRAGVCYVLHGRCASLHHPCVFLQWVVTEQACASTRLLCDDSVDGVERHDHGET